MLKFLVGIYYSISLKLKAILKSIKNAWLFNSIYYSIISKT
ncbi:hypothetical protein [Campylobacter phage CJLB-12]|nr:hypothetical protein [Campylobacter phage CJLB-12]